VGASAVEKSSRRLLVVQFACQRFFRKHLLSFENEELGMNGFSLKGINLLVLLKLNEEEIVVALSANYDNSPSPEQNASPKNGKNSPPNT
jgi:hypothetical protein